MSEHSETNSHTIMQSLWTKKDCTEEVWEVEKDLKLVQVSEWKRL